LIFEFSKRRGKGSHRLVRVGDRVTTIPDREIDPKTARKIRKSLGLG
jgi:predicted RNA binding protein YcfA (HicA-like mRNA interferase family)